MKILDLINKGQETLIQKLEDVNFRFESELILSHVLKKDRVWLLTHQNDNVDGNEERLYFSLINRRADGEPFGYITGTKEFMSLVFSVCPGVLIPRPDTETLVCKVIDIFKGKSAKFLDLCTGSGAIAVSIAKYIENASVTAVDISDICIDIATKNTQNNEVAKKVRLIKKDVLADFDLGEKFDCLVSNPPYIKTSTLPSLMKDVKDYEPTLALDGGEDGLLFYRAICSIAKKHLEENGYLFFEVGFDQAEDVKKLMEENNFSQIEFIKDLSGINRVVYGKYTG